MRIISYGHLTPTVTFCNYCGAKLEYSPIDVKLFVRTPNFYDYIVCPVCGKLKVIKERQWND